MTVSMWLLATSVLLTSSFVTFVIVSHNTAIKHRHLPWVSASSPTWYNLIKARVQNVFAVKSDFHALIEKYWSRDQACFIPSALGDLVVVPPTELKWLLDQPDASLNNQLQLSDILQLPYTLEDPRFPSDGSEFKLIARTLTSQLVTLSGDISEEIAMSVDEYFGSTSGKGRAVNIFEAVTKVIARATNRVFVGLPFCRHEDLIKHVIEFTESLVASAFILRRIPESLRGTLAPVVTYRHQQHKKAIAACLLPEIRKRVKAKQAVDREKEHGEESNDFLQWLINDAVSNNPQQNLHPDSLVLKLIAANFAAIHTSSMSFTNAFYDLVSGERANQRIATLRHEAQTVISEHETFSKKAVAKLNRIDSALKESGRLWPLTTISIERKVLQPGGITTPITKTYVPQGSAVAVPTAMIHTDPRTYADPHAYDPERFATLRAKATGDSSEPNGALKAAKLLFSTTSNDIMQFGHGRHVCPGRFFATQELKVIMAYLLLNYDIEPLMERPHTTTVGSSNLCPMNAKVLMTRRQ